MTYSHNYPVYTATVNDTPRRTQAVSMFDYLMVALGFGHTRLPHTFTDLQNWADVFHRLKARGGALMLVTERFVQQVGIEILHEDETDAMISLYFSMEGIITVSMIDQEDVFAYYSGAEAIGDELRLILNFPLTVRHEET